MPAAVSPGLGGGPRPPSRDLVPRAPGEALSPMPDYMRPVTRSAVRKFKKLHEDHMMAKLMVKRNDKKQRNQGIKEDAKQIARKIPMEVLAKDWLKDTKATVETRAFLVDKVLPTLILGVEKLLLEVDKRDLSETDTPDNNFNPINFLAKYLMRNNPKYSNFSEASPYIRGLREISETLKLELFDIEENRLAKIKADARKKREKREAEEAAVRSEKERRETVLKQQFNEWHMEVYHDSKLQLALIQNALKSFSELAEKYPTDIRSRAQFTKEVEPTDDSGKALLLKEFVNYVTEYVCEMPNDIFDQFVIHLQRCALSHRSATEREVRKVVLSQLFTNCDHTGVGILDRHRVLSLFEMFYDKAQTPTREKLRNPRKWPVVDIEIAGNYLDDSDDEAETETTKPSPETQEKKDEEKPAEEKQEVKETPKPIEQEQSQDEKPTEEVKPTEEQAPAETAPTDPQTQTPEPEQQQEEQKADDAEKPQEQAPAVEAEPQETEPQKEAEPQKEVEPQQEAPEGGIDSETQVEAKTPPPGDLAKIVEDEAEEEEANTLKEQREPEKSATTKKSTSEDQEPELERLKEEVASLSAVGDKPMTQQSKVSFAEGTDFKKERTILTSHGSRSQSATSAYDENTVNMHQFVQLTESFMGDMPLMETFNQLMRYLRDGYVETEEERMQRLLKARQEGVEARRKALLNSLFEMWDNDGSGFLDIDEVLTVSKKYKDGMENDAMDKAKEYWLSLDEAERAKDNYKKKTKYSDNRLSKREFREFIYKCSELMGGDFDFFVEFLLSSVERSYHERVRGEARKKWLQQIITAGETSAAQLEPVYKAVFSSLFKDAEAHGGSKVISAYIAMLEKNDLNPARGDHLLRYVAATPDHSECILNKCLFKDMKGISFAAVESGKPIHVPRVNNHGNIHFWNPDNPDEEHDGSFIVVPLKDKKKRVFGLLGIDTLNHPHSRALFITHEIQFFQGVSKAFSIAYHHVDVRQKTMRISESAISWIHRRTPHVHEISAYMVEPDTKGQDYVLRRMMTTDHKGIAAMAKLPARLERKDNLFRDYLFKCVDNSESVTADAYGERHLAIPLRDDQGRAIVVIDISIGKELKALPKSESREVMKMLKLLQMAYKEISMQARDQEEKSVLDGQNGFEGETSVEILFDRLMLMELRENVARLDAKAYAELKSYKEPPQVVHQILKAVLAVFNQQKARSGEFDDWDKCKKYVGPSLSGKILGYDPTSDDTDSVPVDLINQYLDEVPHGAVMKQGSQPAQYLYNWIFVCVSLLEHTRRNKAKQNIITEGEGKETDVSTTEDDKSNEVKSKTDVSVPEQTTRQTTQDTTQSTAETLDTSHEQQQS